MKKNNQLLKSKISQAEVIVTVLLILIVLAGVGILSAFVINLVKNNLTGTECFKTAGQIRINVDEGFTYYSTNGNVYVSVERGQEEFNLTGIAVSIGNERTTKAFELVGGQIYNTPNNIITEYGMAEGTAITLPAQGEKRTYNFSGTDIPPQANSVGVAPMITKGKKCEASDQTQISVR